MRHLPRPVSSSSYTSVSYTHLDVYKRQVQCIPAGVLAPALGEHPELAVHPLHIGREHHALVALSLIHILFEKGKEKILKKVGEECTEVIIAGEKEDKEETVYEIRCV